MLGTYWTPSKYFNVTEFLVGRSTSYAWFMSRPERMLYSTIFVPRTKPWLNTDTVKSEKRELIPATIGTFQFCIVPPRTILFRSEPPNTTSPRTSNSPVTIILSTSPFKSWRFPVVITVPDTSGSKSKRSEDGEDCSFRCEWWTPPDEENRKPSDIRKTSDGSWRPKMSVKTHTQSFLGVTSVQSTIALSSETFRKSVLRPFIVPFAEYAPVFKAIRNSPLLFINRT